MKLGDEIPGEPDAFHRVLAVQNEMGGVDAKGEAKLFGGESAANRDRFNGRAQRVSFVRLVVERLDQQLKARMAGDGGGQLLQGILQGLQRLGTLRRIGRAAAAD